MSSNVDPDDDLDVGETTTGSQPKGDDLATGPTQPPDESRDEESISRDVSADQPSSETPSTSSETTPDQVINSSDSLNYDSTPSLEDTAQTPSPLVPGSGISKGEDVHDGPSTDPSGVDTVGASPAVDKLDEGEEKCTDLSESTFVAYAALLFVICLNCYFNSIQCGFVFDDHKAVVSNMDIRPSTPLLEIFKNDFWGTPLFSDRSHKSYRPLTIMTYRLDYLLWALEPGGYHFINLVLHWALCALILRVFTMFFSQWYAFILALLFAVHPIHTDAIASVVGRAEPLSAILAISALWSYSKASGYRKATDWNYIAKTIALVTMATLCKEQGITIVGVCCAFEVLWLQKINLWEGLHLLKLMGSAPDKIPRWFVESLYRMVTLISAAALLIALRIIIMGAELPHFVEYDNPIAFSSYPVKQLSIMYLFPLNIWLLLNPYKLLCDYSGSTVPLIYSITDPRNLATLNFLGGLGALTYMALCGNSKLSRQISMALAFLVFPFLPASNIFFCVGFVIAERILYMPSLGFCMLVVIGLQQLTSKTRFKHLVYLGLAITVVFHGGRTARRNMDWISRDKLFEAGIHVTTLNSKLWLNYGHYFETNKEFQKAMVCYNASFESEWAVDNGALTEIGRLHWSKGDYVTADKYLALSQQKMAPAPVGGRYQHKYVQTFYYQARIRMVNKTDLPAAETLLKKAIRLNHLYEDAYIHLSDVYVMAEEIPKATGILRKYLTIDSRSCKALNALAALYKHSEMYDEAIRASEECLRYSPNDERAHHMIAEILETSQREAGPDVKRAIIERYKKLAENAKENKMAHLLRIADLYVQLEEYDNAIGYYTDVLKVRPEDESVFLAMGVAYMKQNKSQTAFKYIRRVIELYPDHAPGWQRLGQLYVENLGKLEDGHKAFEKCHQLDPNNLDCDHNICVVLAKNNQFLVAEKCFQQLSAKYPDLETVAKNSKKVSEVADKIRERERRKKEKDELAILEL